MGVDGIGEAIGAGIVSLLILVFVAGVAVGAVLFWLLPEAWPSIKAWIHAVTAVAP